MKPTTLAANCRSLLLQSRAAATLLEPHEVSAWDVSLGSGALESWRLTQTSVLQ